MGTTDFVYKHIAMTLRAADDFATHFPGNVHQSIAPARIGKKRHLIMQYTDGNDTLAFAGGFVGTGMVFLLKVLDASEDDANAVAAVDWLESILIDGPNNKNGDDISGAYVWLDRQGPFSLPVVENDTIWQQKGGFYVAFVDRKEG